MVGSCVGWEQCPLLGTLVFVQSEPSSQNLVSVATDGEIASRMRVVLTGARINTYSFEGVQRGQFTSVGLPTLETSPPPVHWSCIRRPALVLITSALPCSRRCGAGVRR